MNPFRNWLKNYRKRRSLLAYYRLGIDDSDTDKLKRDWKAVGNDIQEAIKQYAAEQYEAE